MSKTKRFWHQLPVWLCVLTYCMFAIIVLMQVLGQQPLAFAYQNQSLLGNLVLWPAALLLIGALYWLRKREKAHGGWSVWRLVPLFAAVLFVQFLVARTCWAHLGWDPQIVHATAEELARGLPVSNSEYFVSCPNNAPITVLLSIPLWVAVQIGLGVPYVVLPYINAVLLNAAAFLCVQCVCQLTQSRTARSFAAVLALGWLALSPYIVYPYTDVYTIVFPVLAFYVYLRCRRPVLKWFLISLLCFAGGAIKPTVLIVLIALMFLGICRFFQTFTLSSWKRGLAIAAVIAVGAIPGRVFQDASTALLAGSSTPDQQLGMAHYLMLGMNGETYGGHSPDDVAYTLSFETRSEGQAANLQRAWERVLERGLMGNIRFFGIKLFKAYADGSFASHGSFLEVEIPNRTDALSTFLRTFYLDRGVCMPYCQTIAQCLWLGVLTLCAIAGLRSRRSPAVALLSLTLLGVTAYLLLFEVWPRYLFLYAPFFVILSSLAFDKPSAPVIE